MPLRLLLLILGLITLAPAAEPAADSPLEARRGFKTAGAGRCGDHSVRDYLARVNAIKRYFALR